jgi:2-methylisocitrate lyase-like PEP mutase family enzyme
MSFGEMREEAMSIVEAVKSIPIFIDADTGYGNAVNVKRTVKSYAQLGLAG